MVIGEIKVKKRVKNIFNNLSKKPDIIVIKNSIEPFIDNNFFYVTGLEKGIFEGAVAILHSDGNLDLLVSELEEESAKKSDVNLHVYKNKNDFEEYLIRFISSAKKIGINFAGLSHKDFNKFSEKFTKSKFVDISDALAKTRLIKDDFEIAQIKKSCRIADEVMKKIPELLKEGVYEYEVAAEIDYLFQKNGADKPAFETISSFGKNTAEPHYSHGDTKLRKGDFALFDFGVCFRKYNSDITRTFMFGKANEKQKEMHRIVLNAQKIGFDTIKPGIKANEVHNAVNSYIDNTRFKGGFIHSTGHSLGLAVHDGEVGLSADCDVKLKENMVFTVEPGVYIPGFGGVRIEDDVLIQRDGVEIFTKTTRDLIEV